MTVAPGERKLLTWTCGWPGAIGTAALELVLETGAEAGGDAPAE